MCSKFDWLEIIHLEKEDPNFSFQQYYQTINSLIDKYMPLKKMTNKEIKQQAKPWITKEILKSILDRDSLYKKYIRAKNLESKAEYEKQYKTLRNKITEEIKQSKLKYFQDFFTKNANNIKNTWKGIKSIICIKSNKKTQHNSLLINNKLISEPKTVADTFISYFSNIATDLKIRFITMERIFLSFSRKKIPIPFS